MAPTTLDLIRRGAAQHGPRTAVSFGDRSLSFAEVDALSARLAHALRARGAVPGTRVALLVNNSLYSVPLNARLSLPEHVRLLQDTGCGPGGVARLLRRRP